jgi:hypothetical protein
MACNSTVEELESQVRVLETNQEFTNDVAALQTFLPYVSPRVRCGLDASDNVIPGANCLGLDVSFGIPTDSLAMIVKIFETPPDYGWPWAVANLGSNILDTLANPTLWLGATSVTLATQERGDRTVGSYNSATATSTEVTNSQTRTVSESLNTATLNDTEDYGDFDNIGNTTTDSYNTDDNTDNSVDCLDGCVDGGEI